MSPLALTITAPKAVEDRADRVDVVRRGAEADAERIAALLAGFRCLQEGVEVPVCPPWRGARRIHRLDVDAGDASS
jgi:hypothetical protein